MLTIDDLSFSYSRNRNVIDGLTLELDKGSVCGLLGPNGTGKSTLLYLICGLLKPHSGSVEYNSMDPFVCSTRFLEDVMIVPEEFSLPNVTLQDYADHISSFYPKFDKEALSHYLDIFGLSEDENLGKMSMGTKKKAFLSVAMACNTSLLLLDEPTNGLDITSKRNFRRAIAACMTDDKSIIISTHQVHDVEQILDHVIIMDKDGICLNDDIASIQEQYRFMLTTSRQRAEEALFALEVPGGYSIVEAASDDLPETEVNLETLFEMKLNDK